MAGHSCADAWAGQSEADFIEIVGGAVKEIPTEDLVGEMKMPMKLVVECDSAAGMEICARTGVDGIGSRDVKYLLLQMKASDPYHRHELIRRMPVTLVTARGTTGSAAAAGASSSNRRAVSIAVRADNVMFIGYKP